MKTLCITVVVLSLTSLYLSAPLTTEETEKEDADLLGTWYAIALTSDACWFKAYTSSLQLPSMTMEVLSKDAANIYNYTTKMSIFGICTIEIDQSQYKNGTFAAVSNKNLSDVSVLRQLDGCSDCIILEMVGPTKSLILLSRRQKVLADQLQTFKKETENHGLSNFQYMNTDHVYENCTMDDTEIADFDPSTLGVPDQKLDNVIESFIECVVEKYPAVNLKDFDLDKYLKNSVEGKF